MHRIAVIDDDEYWCLAIQRFLRNSFEVDTFSYANSLLEELAKDPKRYDLIMVDLSLPSNQFNEIDGRKLIRQIRKTLPEPPLLVLITAFISKNELDSGEVTCEEVDAFLAKDAGLDEILRRIHRLFNSHKSGNHPIKFSQRGRY